MRMTRPLAERVKAIGDWSIWSLPRWLTAYVIAIVVADVAAIGVAARFPTYSLHDLALFGLLGCAAAAVEMARKAGEQGGLLIKDTQGVWELPVAILLPPFYALIIPIVHTALTHGGCGPAFCTDGCSPPRRSACPTAPRRSPSTACPA